MGRTDPSRRPAITPLSREQLDFVVPARPPRHRPPMPARRFERLRRVFLDGLTHQIGLAHDPDYRYPVHRVRRRDGERVRELTYKSPSPWWYEEDGTTYVRLNFGERETVIPGKNPVLRVGPHRAVLPTLESLHVLVAAGELDDVIERMVLVSP